MTEITGFQLGVDSFVETSFDAARRATINEADRIRDLLEEIELLRGTRKDPVQVFLSWYLLLIRVIIVFLRKV